LQEEKCAVSEKNMKWRIEPHGQ